jgi:hypothetical protein
VQQRWDEVFDDFMEDPIPDDPQAAVDKYFNDNDRESYFWHEIEVDEIFARILPPIPVSVGDIPDAADVNEMKKTVKELAQLAEELIQDRGRRLFDCQVDVVKAHERIQEARKLIAKKKVGRADEIFARILPPIPVSNEGEPVGS